MVEEIVFKIILVGQSGVGKTALSRRYIQKVFPENDVSTIGVDLGVKKLEIDGLKIQLKIWDSAGSERFRSIAKSYYRNADAAILVYALDSPDTLFELQSWSRVLCNHGDMLKVLVGNKSDLREQRTVSEDMAMNFGLLENIELLVECSAKRDDNVEYLFWSIAKKLLSKKCLNDSVLVNETDVTRKKFLKYTAANKSMENLTLCKHNPRTAITLKPKKKDIFKKFCIIL